MLFARYAAARLIVIVFLSPAYFPSVSAQTGSPKCQAPSSTTVERAASGDVPDDPGPLAMGLAPDLKSASIRAAMKKVGDWQLTFAEQKFNSQWTFAALYDGLLAASTTTGDPAYRDAVFRYAERQEWKLLNCRFPHADDIALGQAYLDLYMADPVGARRPARIADTKVMLDQVVMRADDKEQDLWWWCDALFMAPPVLARMSAITGDPKYLAYMDRQWAVTTWHLYSPENRLYFRDARYFTQHEENGKPIFWARGNGWVMGALVKVLQVMPASDPSRPKYVALLRDMAEEVASIQGPDGLWRSGLLDPGSYDLPEVSGSAFFTYGIAYGINEHILDAKVYEPVVARSWKGMLSHIFADGRLGSIQPIDGQPGKFKPSASYVYGVGGFLLAGSELDRMATAR